MKLLSISEGAGLQVYMNNIIDWQDRYGDLGQGSPAEALSALSPSWHVRVLRMYTTNELNCHTLSP